MRELKPLILGPGETADKESEKGHSIFCENRRIEVWHRLWHMYVSCPGRKLSGKLGGGISREIVREVPVKIYLARDTKFTETSLTTSRLTSREVLEDV